MNPPTAREIEIFEAVQRNGGVQSAAARELGTSQGSVRSAWLIYLRKTGQPVPEPKYQRSGPRTPRAPLQREVWAQKEKELVELRDRVEDLDNVAQRLDRIEALVRQLLARPTGVVDHRRLADGGRHAKAQRTGSPAA